MFRFLSKMTSAVAACLAIIFAMMSISLAITNEVAWGNLPRSGEAYVSGRRAIIDLCYVRQIMGLKLDDSDLLDIHLTRILPLARGDSEHCWIIHARLPSLPSTAPTHFVLIFQNALNQTIKTHSPTFQLVSEDDYQLGIFPLRSFQRTWSNRYRELGTTRVWRGSFDFVCPDLSSYHSIATDSLSTNDESSCRNTWNRKRPIKGCLKRHSESGTQKRRVRFDEAPSTVFTYEPEAIVKVNRRKRGRECGEGSGTCEPDESSFGVLSLKRALDAIYRKHEVDMKRLKLKGHVAKLFKKKMKLTEEVGENAVSSADPQ